MGKKLERQVSEMAAKMLVTAREIEEFGELKLESLPTGQAWTLLQASLKLVSAASKVQLRAARQSLKDTRKHFGAPT